MADERRFDLIVLGSGAGGSTAAFEAAARGAKVAMIEQWLVGGTCLNAGCDPTKTLVRSAEIAHLARVSARHGISTGAPAIDWPAIRQHVADVIDTIRGGDGDANVRNAGIDLVKAHGRFLSPTEVLAGGERLTAEKIIIATGARAKIPDIPGLAEIGCLTNRDVPTLPALPKSLAIIGGGTIGVEFAQIFARLGVEVTLFGSRDRIMPREDEECSRALREILERDGVRIETGIKLTSVERAGGRKRLRGAHGEETIFVDVDDILVAAGREPAIEGLGLEKAGVETGPKGIVVNDQLCTTAPNIWAVGDVIGDYPFTHIADYQARIAEHNAMSGKAPVRANYKATPWVTFTDPELARVGLTEAEARAVHSDVVIGLVKMKDIARAITSGETEGFVKLVAKRSTGEILGAHILSAHGGELLPEIVLAMRNNLPVSVIADAIHAYPTFAEAVFWAAFSASRPEPLIEMHSGQIVAEPHG
jgi:pyruvate/2-oxoglutarate dehydrogenase complex dihydrolipoamide dehydrogenase (E3) component